MLKICCLDVKIIYNNPVLIWNFRRAYYYPTFPNNYTPSSQQYIESPRPTSSVRLTFNKLKAKFAILYFFGLSLFHCFGRWVDIVVRFCSRQGLCCCCHRIRYQRLHYLKLIGQDFPLIPFEAFFYSCKGCKFWG